jgi:hypothetical protein
MAVKD